MKAAFHTNRQEACRAQTHVFHPTLCFDHEHTGHLWYSGEEIQHAYSRDTHAPMHTRIHTHTHTSSWSAARTNSTQLCLAAASPPDSL